jgi:Flp pilus assembly protein TadD
VYDSVFGKLDEAIQLSRRILQSDPLDTTALNNLAYMQCLARRFTECASGYRRLLEISPQIAQGYGNLGVALMQRGDLGEAKAAVDKETSEPQKLAGLALVYTAMGRTVEAQSARERLRRKYGASQPYLLAEVYAFQGNAAAAFYWLEHAYQQRDDAMACIKSDPLLGRIRSDSRYRALLLKMKLPDT